MGNYNNGVQFVFPLGNLGRKAILTHKQMQEVVNHLLTGEPLPTYSKEGFGLDPKVALLMFYSKNQILKIYEEERPRVPTKPRPATVFPLAPLPVNSGSLKSYKINLNNL